VAYHEYEGVALSTDEQERLIQDLGGHRAMILRNHGLLTAGETIARAFHEIYFLERACQAQVKALSGGAELHYPAEEVRIKTAKQFASPLVEPILQRAWQAALSLIEHQYTEYAS
jgi:ribulose-5-phosphate 4-epimerase/fuculose-1-phosphate aldolase